MKYSVIIPCYNSSETIRNVVELTAEELRRMKKIHYEFVLVNDCSPDGGKTIRELNALAKEKSFVKVVDLAKNAGQHNATMAGFNYADGDIIIMMDDDLQTHPSQLHILLDELDLGYDVVYGYYPDKKHGFFRNLGSKFNSFCVRLLIGKPKDLKTSSYCVMRKFVKDNIINYTGPYSYMQGLVLRTTKNISCIPVEHFKRENGSSNYTFKSLIKLWSCIIGFSITPLRVAAVLGYIFSFLSLIGAIAIFIAKLANPAMLMGWPSLMVAICFFFGLMFLFLGLIGEYIGRMFLSLGKSPQYVVKNFTDKKS